MTFISSCSQNKNTVVSKFYNNTTARYNAYFLASEKMKEVEQKIKDANIDDYNKVLKIYPVIQEGTRSSLKQDLDYIIEKAALPINKHKNSNWVDDSYNLIGKARLYQKEYKLATETFKYVNTKSKDIDARHVAMIMLLRTFLDTLQAENAKTVTDFLKKEKIGDINQAEYHLSMAYYYQVFEDTNACKQQLETAVKYIGKREDKARVYFIIGQLYQLQDNDQEAYKNYSLVLKNNPPYELSFYARLYLAQVSNLAQASNKKKIDKYFKKLLRDQKNVEYKDKIYYEMGKYELKQQNYDKSINRFQTSLQVSKGNEFQKARTYLALGKLYYENLQQYMLSKLYYDSTVALWDKKDKEYKPISMRQKILEEFVHYITIGQREDSLLRLSKMDSLALDKYMDKILDDAAKKQKELEIKLANQKARKEAEKIAAEANASKLAPINFQRPGLKQTQTWYFYNAVSIAQGKADFIKKWGKRVLEDDWRRSGKEKEIKFQTEEKPKEVAVDLDKLRLDSIAARKNKKAEMRKDIPITQAEIDTANSKIEDALFNIGKIYNLKLNEPNNAVDTFDSLLVRYPRTKHKPEVYYLLYLLYKKSKDAKEDIYKQKLFKEFPKSLYAKIIHNPNYLKESKVLNQKVSDLYSTAFSLYEQKAYIQSDSMLASIKTTYPQNNIEDKIVFLGILNARETRSVDTYIQLLKTFTVRFPHSDLTQKAKALIEETNKYIAEQKALGFDLTNRVKFQKNFARPHLFVVLLQNKSFSKEIVMKEIRKYNTSKGIKDKEIQATLINSSNTVSVSIFPDKEVAQAYLNAIIESQATFKNAGESLSFFTISTDNYKILEASGNVVQYLDFYKKNYNDHLIYGN